MTYLLSLLLKSGDQMNRRMFDTLEAAKIFANNNTLPPYALCWWIECYDSEGILSWSQGHAGPYKS